MKKRKNIGIFDSGFGGISTLRAIAKELPDYSYTYLGDNARTPYGTRSQDAIYNFSLQAVKFLLEKNCDLIIFACNTASSKALRKIQQEYINIHHPEKRVLGVLIPAVEEAALQTKNQRVGVIATEGSVRSMAFVKELKIINKKIKVYQKATPLLVPLVESGEHNTKITDLILEKYLIELLKKDIDTLILGCTHYGILERKIKKIVGPQVTIISDTKVVPKKLKDYLSRHPEIDLNLKQEKTIEFYTTDLTDKFTLLGGRFFGKKIEAKKASL